MARRYPVGLRLMHAGGGGSAEGERVEVATAGGGPQVARAARLDPRDVLHRVAVVAADVGLEHAADAQDAIGLGATLGPRPERTGRRTRLVPEQVFADVAVEVADQRPVALSLHRRARSPPGPAPARLPPPDDLPRARQSGGE